MFDTNRTSNHPQTSQQRGTADADIQVRSVENPELTNVLSLKPGVGQIIAMHASPTARTVVLVCLLPPRSINLIFFTSSPYSYVRISQN